MALRGVGPESEAESVRVHKFCFRMSVRSGLTMIRRNCVSPISAFPQGGRWIKGKHGFFIIKTDGSEQAEIPRPNPAVDALASLQPANRGSLYRLDSALYSLSWQATPAGFGRKRYRKIPEQSGGGRACRRSHPKPARKSFAHVPGASKRQACSTFTYLGRRATTVSISATRPICESESGSINRAWRSPHHFAGHGV